MRGVPNPMLAAILKVAPKLFGLGLLAFLPSGCASGSVRIRSKEISTAAHPPEKAPGLLDVVTFNVAGLPRFVAPRDPRPNHRLLGPPLGAFDLVLLQEDFWYHDLIEAPHRWRSRPRAATPLWLGDGLACFSWLPLGRIEHHAWSASHGILHHFNDSLAAKGFSVGKVEVAAGHQIWVYNVHFDAGWDSGDRRARKLQRAQLREHITRRVPGDAALIIAGDFNCGPDSLEELRAAIGLTDCGVGGIDRMYFRSGRDVMITVQGPAPGAQEDSPVDGTTVEVPSISASLKALRGLSDHAPVWVRFEIAVSDKS